jgi:hypothetical protein
MYVMQFFHGEEYIWGVNIQTKKEINHDHPDPTLAR